MFSFLEKKKFIHKQTSLITEAFNGGRATSGAAICRESDFNLL